MVQMSAWFGGPRGVWELRRVEVPAPGPGQVLVRAGAVALNNADAAVLNAATEDYLAGYELAGEVVAVGEGVTRLVAGDVVAGTTDGAFAEHVLLDARHAFRLPTSVPAAEAAALPTALLTEHGALAAGAFEPGQAVLVTGATSSIGLVGLQVAAELGASQVIATTRSADRRELLVGRGADLVVATGEQDLTATVLEATDGQGVDLVLDHVGGETFAACLPATRVDGHVVNIGRLGGALARVDLDAVSFRQLRVRGVSFGFGRPEELAAVVEAAETALTPALEAGRVAPLVAEVLPFEEAPAALQLMRSGNAVGKMVLRLA